MKNEKKFFNTILDFALCIFQFEIGFLPLGASYG
jgi:hypothetical protein